MAVFRIFTNDDNPKVWSREMKAYESHLKAIPRKHPVLMKYFAGNFFHDGILEKMEFSNNQSAFSFRILCPNLKEFGKTNWKYKDVWYRCEFRDVAYFTITTKKHDEMNNPLGGTYTEYINSEIDTLKEHIERFRKNYGKNFHSLIIQLSPSERYMILIFSDVRVYPQNPDSFKKMVQHRNIYVPTFQKGMNRTQERIYRLVEARKNKSYKPPGEEPKRSKEWERIEAALSIYYGDHDGVWPPSLKSLVPKYLQKIPLDGPSKSRKVVSRFDGTGGWVYRKHKEGIRPNRKLEME